VCRGALASGQARQAQANEVCAQLWSRARPPCAEGFQASTAPLHRCRACEAAHPKDGLAAQAVLFCLETQYRLLESAWPAEVLSLPSCKEVTATDGSLLFRGPRVRMGIHWAGEGTVAHRCRSLMLLLQTSTAQYTCTTAWLLAMYHVDATQAVSLLEFYA
jgi:hypothetical protein